MEQELARDHVVVAVVFAQRLHHHGQVMQSRARADHLPSIDGERTHGAGRVGYPRITCLDIEDAQRNLGAFEGLLMFSLEQ
ncbi:hypothetical protein [Bradyrhizobium elkanii]|uniref:hypothetical protein n=1 Tax=Bradyrhizobium elkanii TaxID=29448 RepID=UPI002FF19EBF